MTVGQSFTFVKTFSPVLFGMIGLDIKSHGILIILDNPRDDEKQGPEKNEQITQKSQNQISREVCVKPVKQTDDIHLLLVGCLF